MSNGAAVPMLYGIPVKYLSLAVLTIQNSLLVLIMRYSRVVSSLQFYASTAVLMSELIKLTVCFVLSAKLSIAEHNKLSIRLVLNDILGGDSWKLLIPAGLYTIQNNLQYTAVTLLDAATFQVTYQLKILTTALCAVAILNTRLSRTRWLALLALTVGVILVQLPSSNAPTSGGQASGASLQFLGLLAVLIACILSGLAGVYFEKVLKGSRKSVWTRNAQLSLFSIAPALFGVFIVDGQEIGANGFFYGYTGWTYGAIACQAVGGLIVAVVVKYADNILKGFATSISIIISCLASVWIFGFQITPLFIVGTALVIYATYMYGRPESTQPAVLPVSSNENNKDEEPIPMGGLQGKDSDSMHVQVDSSNK
ncbi:UDP-galactose transporter Gms1 [Coemansia sp. RSA 1821]|nr:UDP-galactose transporter Gms1 [Coemansia sp. RSA 1086]KAJ1752587.1 UDP-galactose transporter Gms1 [Coemansia sp. RSA 1821]KAJ2649048.1 UDP-galactose transporter Gms1 [Coemansia sp. RSA 1250]KAJ2671743.1 UDP-galactose transporter Gms1 [Coemansia sp. RSA 1085]